MKNQTGIIVLILICVALIAAIIWSQRQSTLQRSRDEASIGSYSNKWVDTSASLDQQRQVNTSLEGDLKKQRDSFLDLTNNYTQVSSNLEQTQTTLKSTREDVARRDAKIADLESQNQALDQRALDLSTAITNLTSQIDDTKQKLAASEGTRRFWKRSWNGSSPKRPSWKGSSMIWPSSGRRSQAQGRAEHFAPAGMDSPGLFARAEQKGAEQLMQKPSPSINPAAKTPTYDLNVEVNADGSVKIIPPLANKPAETNSPPPADTNSPPAQ